MGLQTEDLMALVGAHSAGTQRFVDTSLAGEAFDSTVDIWDVRFCEQHLILSSRHSAHEYMRFKTERRMRLPLQQVFARSMLGHPIEN